MNSGSSTQDRPREKTEARIAQLEEVVNTAEEFHKLYYDTLDKRRHLMGRLYMDTSVLVWDGNSVQGATDIQKFYEGLPTTTHTIHGMDAQPVPESATNNQKTVIVQVEGNVFIQHGGDKAPRQFYQSFTITAQEDKWKIITDCFRLLPDNRS